MLNWNTTHSNNQTLHCLRVSNTAELQIRKTIEACADKAISLLASNIQDDSLYLLFEWNSSDAGLNILVTDATKRHDAPEIVHCSFPDLANEVSTQEQRNTYAESVHFWLHDYLTTCTAFFNYSLVAIFHSSNRENTELL
jgi:hypothetical protein